MKFFILFALCAATLSTAEPEPEPIINLGFLQHIAKPLLQLLNGFLTREVNGVQDTTNDLGDATQGLGNTVLAATSAAKNIVNPLLNTVAGTAGLVPAAVEKIVEGLGTKHTSLGALTKPFLQVVQKGLQGAKAAIKGATRGLTNINGGVGQIVTNTTKAVQTLVKDTVGATGNLLKGVPTVANRVVDAVTTRASKGKSAPKGKSGK